MECMKKVYLFVNTILILFLFYIIFMSIRHEQNQEKKRVTFETQYYEDDGIKYRVYTDKLGDVVFVETVKSE